ncbi:putative ran guanine nucleotide release factor [Diplonema papillatum]|nr:putative ran guanine nucleotide release factor [Diplonema papillatum]
MSFSTKPMYGGAMEMSIPASFVDTSDFRQVPDHQEVWADMDTNRSIILEILEPVEQSHEESARYHFNELAKANGCTPADARVLECGRLDLPNFPQAVTKAYLKGEQVASKFNETAKNVVTIELAVVRLPPPASADLLLTINTPSVVSAESSDAAAPVATQSVFQPVVTSLKLLDPGLFGS